MTSPVNTTFTSGTTITSNWLNGANDHVNDLEPNAHNATNITYNEGSTGAENRSVTSKLQEFVSVTDFGAIGDGVTDDSAAIQACIDAVIANGGGIVAVPTGTYKCNTGLVGGSNVNIQCETDVTFDFTSAPTGNVALTFSGSVDDPVLLGVNAERGDTTLTTATPHGLVAGDWIFLMSQRAALHQDAGLWQLGNPTGVAWYASTSVDAGDLVIPKLPNGFRYRALTTGTTSATEPTWPTTLGGTVVDNNVTWEAYAYFDFMPFFAEPLQVRSVISATEIRLETPLIFPSYRINRDEETYISDRVSTIQKINFCETPQVSGNPTFKILNPTTSSLSYGIVCEWCYQPNIEAEFQLGNTPSEGLRFAHSYYGNANVKAYRPSNWSIGPAGHAAYNSFRDLMSWWSNWYYEDYYGSQGLDVTYGGGGLLSPSIQPTISGKAYSPRETGLTFHSGSFGGNVINFSAANCLSTGIYNRSRFVTITNFYGISGKTNEGRGILLGSWSTDCVVTDFNINGFQYGISIDIDNEQGVCAPHNRNTLISNGSISNAYVGVRFTVPGGEGAASSDPCGINLNNVKFNNNQLYHIWIDNYWNFGRVSNCAFGPLLNSTTGVITTGRQAIIVQANAVAWTFENLDFINLGADNNGIGPGYTITDTTTFPPAEFPWPRHKVYTSTLNVIGVIKEVYNTPTIGYYRPTASFTIPDWCSGDTIMCYSGSTIVVTIPTDTVNIPIGSTITLIQEGAGIISLSPAVGVNLIAKGTDTSVEGDVITLTKLQTNKWAAVGNLT